MKVTICSGASGSGKSTWAKAQVNSNDEEVMIFSADDFFMVGGEYCFNRDQLPDAHADCLRRYVEELTDERPDYYIPLHIIVDNTNTTVAEVAPYWALAQAYGAEVTILQFTGEFENVHGVPKKQVENMRKRASNLKRFAPPWWSFETHEEKEE